MLKSKHLKGRFGALCPPPAQHRSQQVSIGEIKPLYFRPEPPIFFGLCAQGGTGLSGIKGPPPQKKKKI